MAYQITGEKHHEHLGMLMFFLVLIHQFLNRRWYSSVLKGRYGSYRILTTAANVLLLLSFALTAISGMSISSHAAPFMHGIMKPSLARVVHLGMSFWSFALMGLHLEFHGPGMMAGVKTNRVMDCILSFAFIAAAGGMTSRKT